jgi:hypothetical protein
MACALAAAPAIAFDPATDHTCVYGCGGSSGSASPSPRDFTPDTSQEDARRRRTLEENQRAAEEARKRDQRQFGDSRDEAARELRGVATSPDAIKGPDDELRDAPAARRKAPNPGSKQSAQAQPPAARAGEPTTMKESPADWNCYPPEPQENGAWEYLQCAGSVAERARRHCFEKRGDALKPIACGP